MVVNSITDAKAHLSALIEEVQKGEQVIIKKAGRPVAVLSPYVAVPSRKVPGALAGRVHISPDFDELPADIAQAFGTERD